MTSSALAALLPASPPLAPSSRREPARRVPWIALLVVGLLIAAFGFAARGGR